MMIKGEEIDSNGVTAALARMSPLKCPSPDIDKGWAWVILGVAFFSSAIVYGHIVNSGIYFTTFLNAYGESRTYTAWVTTAHGIALHITGSVGSYLLARCGVRITMTTGALIASLSLLVTYFANSVSFLIVTFAINGVGISLLMSSSLASISLYFKKYFYLAVGLTNSGAGLGIMVMGLELECVIAVFGWKGSMLIQSGIMLQLLVCAALILPIRTEQAQTHPSTYKTMKLEGSLANVGNSGIYQRTGYVRRRKTASPVHFMKDLRYQLILMIFFTFYLAFNVFLLIMKDAFLGKQFEMPYTTIIISFGISNIAGRLSSGMFAEYLLVPPLQFFFASTIVSAISLSIIFVDLPWLYTLCIVIFGFCSGQQSSLLSLTVAYLFTKELMPVLFSFALIMGVPSFVGGAPIAGYIKDVTGSYNGAYFLSALGFFLCGLLNLFCYVLHRRKLCTEQDKAEMCTEKLLFQITNKVPDSTAK